VDAAATEVSPLPAHSHAAITTEPGPFERSPFYAAPAKVPATVSPAEPGEEHQWKPASAQVGRYFGSALPDAADPAQAAALHTGGSASGQSPDDSSAWLEQHSGLPALKHGDGGGDDDATVTRLRIGISRGGHDGLLGWRLLVQLLARRAAATPSTGATVVMSHPQHCYSVDGVLRNLFCTFHAASSLLGSAQEVRTCRSSATAHC